jgi:hypothetical protein
MNVARSGYKHGCGRPKGAVSSIKHPLTPAQIAAEAARVGLSPLNYMLSVMNDELCDPIRRDRMAVAAAPFIHKRADADRIGKKLRADLEARDNDVGTPWEELLRRDKAHYA